MHSSPHCEQEHTSLDARPVAAPVNTRERRARRIRTKLNALVASLARLCVLHV